MPWTEKQVRLFRAAAHNPEIAKAHGMSQKKAGEMASEGVKKPSPMALARGLRGSNQTSK